MSDDKTNYNTDIATEDRPKVGNNDTGSNDNKKKTIWASKTRNGNNKSNANKNNITGSKSKFQGGTTGLEEHNGKGKNSMTRLKKIRRIVEALVGIPIANILTKTEMKSSKLVGPKQVFLPRCRIPMNYYEREAVQVSPNKRKTSADQQQQQQQQQKEQQQQQQQQQKQQQQQQQQKQQHPPTILLLHGFGSSALEFCSFLRDIDFPPHVRILAPELIGHGEDLKRVFGAATDSKEGSSSLPFQQPDAETLLESTSEFLDVVEVGPNCNALGTSLGGAILYYLRRNRPEIIQKTVLVAPAIMSCISDGFLNGLVKRKHRFMDFHSRDDVKHLFRNFLWTDPRKRTSNNNGNTPKRRIKKDPIPKVVYEVVYRLWQRDVPEGHHKALQDTLLRTHVHNTNGCNESTGIAGSDDNANGGENTTEHDNIFAATTDIDRDSPRLLVWPEEDQISDIEKGKRFFGPSVASGRTVLKTIQACGHVFHADGTPIYELVVPVAKAFLLDF
jgi:pimeloyl-ACP methyl ester carboxylesterase